MPRLGLPIRYYTFRFFIENHAVMFNDYSNKDNPDTYYFEKLTYFLFFSENVILLHFEFLTKFYRYEKNYNDACVFVVCRAQFCLCTNKND